MGRLIDADDIPYVTPLRQTIAYKEDIDKMPTIDAVEVVRCKECKHYDKLPTWAACTYWSGDPYEQASVNADDFCSYGERKEADDETN